MRDAFEDLTVPGGKKRLGKIRARLKPEILRYLLERSANASNAEDPESAVMVQTLVRHYDREPRSNPEKELGSPKTHTGRMERNDVPRGFGLAAVPNLYSHGDGCQQTSILQPRYLCSHFTTGEVSELACDQRQQDQAFPPYTLCTLHARENASADARQQSGDPLDEASRDPSLCTRSLWVAEVCRKIGLCSEALVKEAIDKAEKGSEAPQLRLGLSFCVRVPVLGCFKGKPEPKVLHRITIQHRFLFTEPWAAQASKGLGLVGSGSEWHPFSGRVLRVPLFS